jgi:hypothetical protein
MERAKQHKMKLNLEIPATFKGNSFAILNSHTLSDASDDIDLDIGNDIVEKNLIIADLVNAEHERSFNFANQNPKIVLPNDLDIDDANDPNSNTSGLMAEPIDHVGWTTVNRSNRKTHCIS